jgi:hypothetical protein
MEMGIVYKKTNKGDKSSQTMSYLGKNCMSIALKDYAKKFMPKKRAYKILKNKIEDVVQEKILVWKKVFGLLAPPAIEEKEEEETETVELDNQEDYDEPNNLEEHIRRKVEETEQKDVVTIEEIPDETWKILNVLTKEELKNATLMSVTSNTPLSCTNPILIQIKDYLRIENAPTVTSTIDGFQINSFIVEEKGKTRCNCQGTGKSYHCDSISTPYGHSSH